MIMFRNVILKQQELEKENLVPAYADHFEGFPNLQGSELCAADAKSDNQRHCRERL